MPLPSPHKNEERDDFIARCMAAIEGDDMTQDQKVATCMSKWREGKSGNFRPLLAKVGQLMNSASEQWNPLADMPVARMDEESDDPEVMLVMFHDNISDEGITSNDLVARMKAINPSVEIVFDINSEGGSVFDSMSIHAAMVEHPGPVRADITGIAGSAATIVASGGDQIRINEGGGFFVHEATSLFMGNKRIARALADMLEDVDRMIVDVLSNRSGLDKQEVSDLMEKDGFGKLVNGKEAVEMGFADTLIPTKRREQRTANTKEVEVAAKAYNHAIGTTLRKLKHQISMRSN